MRRKRKIQRLSLEKKRGKSALSLPSLDVHTHISREIKAICYILFAVLTFLSMSHTAGPIGEFWVTLLSKFVGLWGTYLLIVLCVIRGILIFLFQEENALSPSRLFGLTLLVVAFLGWVQISAGITDKTALEDTMVLHGGYIGFIMGYLLYTGFKEAASYILFALFVIGGVMMFGVSIKEMIQRVHAWRTGALLLGGTDNSQEIPEHVLENMLQMLPKQQKEKKGVVATKAWHPTGKKDFQVVAPDTTKPLLTQLLKRKEEKTMDIHMNTPIDENFQWEFPSIDLLEEPPEEVFYDDADLRANAKKIEGKLLQFGIEVHVKDVKVGPTVMQYSVQPAEDVKLSKIVGLRDDLKLALAAESLRIEAPIPGKALVGIEVPNDKRTPVRLKELLLAPDFFKMKTNLRLPLGKDVSGVPVISDLGSMPHLLIAGQTGSGKSIGINAIIISLLYQNSPRDLRLILIDPKRVELKVYNHIPHLLTPVITEVDKAMNALKWLIAEMMRRYGELEKIGVRNRAEYNEKVTPDKRMPHIVCVIDELAEMMMSGDKKAIEAAICRLAQLARAVGIHMIVATQRPSVDVITGLIKANIPSRIAFRTASSVDSRTILDTIGAEDLLGKGDMLFLHGNASDLVRIQCTFVPTSEVEKVVNKIKVQTPDGEVVQYVDDVITPQEESTLKGSIYDGEDAEDDELLQEAIDVLRMEGKASTSLLQRRLKIGYGRAARMLDTLHEKGIVGPADGSKPRKVLLSSLSPVEEETQDIFVDTENEE